MLPDPRSAILNDGHTTVLVTSAGGATLRLTPEAVASLVAGEYTHHRGGKGEKRRLTMRRVPDAEVPTKLRQAIRVFCAKRRVPIAVYAFRRLDEETGESPADELHIILWLRDTDNDFYNDFSLMVGRVKPPRLELLCGVVTSEESENVAFLQQNQPLWPILNGPSDRI